MLLTQKSIVIISHVLQDQLDQVFIADGDLSFLLFITGSEIICEDKIQCSFFRRKYK